MSSRHPLVRLACALSLVLGLLAVAPAAQGAENADNQENQERQNGHLPDEIDARQTYMPVVLDRRFDEIREEDEAEKEEVLEGQQQLLEERYDLSDNPSDVWMSGKRRKVQQGVRVKLPDDVSWEDLAEMTPEEIKENDLFPAGFRPLPHVKHPVGGMVFPEDHIEAIAEAEGRDLERFDVEFDLPDHLMPEFPPPMFLQTRPDLGDVTHGQVLTIKNLHELLEGRLTPVQMEGMRLLVTPFPQQQFNATEDRKVAQPSFGVTCFDCHVNGHTNAAFHLNPDARPQSLRHRLDTPSLRGVFNQHIHGSKRALRSLEDFTEFEQRIAYFDGDHVTAAKKGMNVLERGSQVAAMAQAQNILDFPPAPKLNRFGRLDHSKATEQEIKGEELFFGKAQCGVCHPAPTYLDNLMHDLKLEEFFEPKMVRGQFDQPIGPMKTLTVRGIKDSPPFLHDGRLMTLDDTVEFFNLVFQLKLDQEEKDALVAFMLCL
jgi:cytochrome c peroxidase